MTDRSARSGSISRPGADANRVPRGPGAGVTVLAADSSPLSLIGLEQTVRGHPDLDLIAAVSDGPRTIAAIRSQPPAVAIIDAYLEDPDGCELTRTVRAEQLNTRTLIIAERPTGELVLRCFTAGAAGFLSKRTSPDALISAIQRVAEGGSVLSTDLGSNLADVLKSRGDTEYTTPSPRELEVLGHIARGESAGDIAHQLGLSTPTIKTHIQSLYIKLGVNDRAAAVATAIRRGYLK